MSGKITYKDGLHPSRTGHLVPYAEISAGDWRAMEEAVGPLSDADKAIIREVCANYKDMAGSEASSLPDSRATLAAIMRLTNEDELRRAVGHCDGQTHEMIEGALYAMDGPNFWKQVARPAKLRAAAWLALDKIKAGKRLDGPKGINGRLYLAEWVLEFCATRNFPNDEPAKGFFLALLWASDPKTNAPQHPSVATRLFAELRRQVIA